MSEESDRMMVLLQELAALKNYERTGARGREKLPSATARRRRRMEIAREMKRIAKEMQKKKSMGAYLPR